ncbi:MAG: universal stress protein [Pseudomonadota bacterium]
MKRVLVGMDGSESALRALRELVDGWLSCIKPNELEVHLVNVQTPLARDVNLMLGEEQVAGYYRREHDKALEEARSLLDRAGIRFEESCRVGDPAAQLADYARQQNVSLIVLGTRGLGDLRGLLLGSVTHKLMHLTNIPVLLVK